MAAAGTKILGRLLRGLTLAVCVAALLSAAGCGGSGNPVEKAAVKSLGSPGATTSFTGAMRIPGSAKPISFSGSGTIDNRERRTRVTVDLSSLAAAAGGKLGKPRGFRGEEIADTSGSTVLYLRFPYFAQQLDTTKPWVRIDVGTQLATAGFNPGSLALNQGNPGQYLDYLRSTTGKVRKVGTADVAGVSTTHYSVTVDLLEYPTKLPKARQAEADTVSNRLIQLTGTRFFPADVWVDDAGYVRQLTFAYSIAIPDSTAKIDYRTTVRYDGYGRKTRIALPPPGDVATIGPNGSSSG